MDSLSQLTLGAAVGEAVLGEKVGRRAALWGAIAGTIPDLDIIPGKFVDYVTRLEMHRGFSHSIIFCLIAAPILGWLLERYQLKTRASFREWTKLFFWALFTHPLLDSFTGWGTQLFWPLDYRIAWQTISIVDPLYTVPLLICLLIALCLHNGRPARRLWNTLGLTLSCAYLLVTVINFQIMYSFFEEQFSKKGVSYTRLDLKPSLLNNIMWTAIAEGDKKFFLATRSYFDSDEGLKIETIPKNHQKVHQYREDADVRRLIQITTGLFSIVARKDGFVINDLRFGRTNEWHREKARRGEFVFGYFVKVRDGKAVGISEVAHRPKVSSQDFRNFLERILNRKAGYPAST